jgi:hypothetical protein
MPTYVVLEVTGIGTDRDPAFVTEAAAAMTITDYAKHKFGGANVEVCQVMKVWGADDTVVDIRPKRFERLIHVSKGTP